jgi:hypothetical protein
MSRIRTECSQQAQIEALHGNAKTDEHAPSNGLGVEPDALPQAHLVLLVGGGFGIADHNAGGAGRG